jgi:hypothetical protein
VNFLELDRRLKEYGLTNRFIARFCYPNNEMRARSFANTLAAWRRGDTAASPIMIALIRLMALLVPLIGKEKLLEVMQSVAGPLRKPGSGRPRRRPPLDTGQSVESKQ